MFKNRETAGRQLAMALSQFAEDDPVVLGIPRGGAIVAAEVAKMLDCAFDLIMPRKIGAPGNPELAVGAVAGDGQVLLNTVLIESLGVSPDYIEEEVEKAVNEINRRRRKYFGDAAPIDLRGRLALLVDDGLATGYTALAAIKAAKMAGPAKVVLAVPVAPKAAAADLAQEVDEFIALATPEPFLAVGQFYSVFPQVSDTEVVAKLQELRAA